MKSTILITLGMTALLGLSSGQTLDPSQTQYVKQYEKQPNPPKPEAMLLNTDKEPDLSEGFSPLLSGNDLEGWKPLGGKCTYEIKDGVVTGTLVKGSESTYLSSEKSYGNFIFTCEMKWIVNSNSGVMFRARQKADKKRGVLVYGPQAEMEGFTERGWSGGIYGQDCGGWWYPLWLKEHADLRKALKQGEWNRLTVEAKGNTVKTWVNGVPAAHWKNDEYLEGFFGLQIHQGKEGQVQWRGLKVKELK